jgi:hypothetical protein
MKNGTQMTQMPLATQIFADFQVPAFVGVFSNNSDGSLLEKTPTKAKKLVHLYN